MRKHQLPLDFIEASDISHLKKVAINYVYFYLWLLSMEKNIPFDELLNRVDKNLVLKLLKLEICKNIIEYKIIKNGYQLFPEALFFSLVVLPVIAFADISLKVKLMLIFLVLIPINIVALIFDRKTIKNAKQKYIETSKMIEETKQKIKNTIKL